MKIFNKDLTDYEKEPEVKKIAKDISVSVKKTDEVVQKIDDKTEKAIIAFKNWDKSRGDYSRDYSKLKKYDHKFLPKTQAEIQDFIDIVERDYTDIIGRLGLFTSYCIDNVYPKDKIEITINKPIDQLGYNTRKHWLINGDVGDNLGQNMQCAKIDVNGDAGDNVGNGLRDGDIHIHGSAGRDLGTNARGGLIIVENDVSTHLAYEMKGGKAIIKGNVSDDDFLGACAFMKDAEVIIQGDVLGDIAYKMKGRKVVVEGSVKGEIGRYLKRGDIYIGGDIEGHISEDIKGGNIYHKGKLIVKNGKWR